MANKASGNGSGSKDGSGNASSSRLSSRKSRQSKGKVGWDDCSPQLLQEVIARVVGEGALISFSKTSDGGALVLYVKDGREESKDYATTADEIAEFLEDLHATYEV